MDHIRGVCCETDLISGERPHVVRRVMKLEVFGKADSVPRAAAAVIALDARAAIAARGRFAPSAP
jgi:hypothetical protein